MKYLLLAFLCLTGCGFSYDSRSFNDNSDPTCLDGYLVSSLSNPFITMFCEQAWVNNAGIEGRRCSDLPYADSRAVYDVRIAEGSVGKTQCFNRLHK